jgi:hypothetical protein
LYKQGQKFKDLFTRQSSNGTNQTTWVPTQDLVDTNVPYSIRIEMSNNASIFDSTQTFYVLAQDVVVKPIIPSISLKLNTTSISKGDSAVLTWNSTQASSVNISGIGDVELNGSKTVSPTKSTSYTAIAISSDGNQASSTVSLSVSEPNIPVPVITLFAVNKTSIELGESVSIMWNTENATSVTIVDNVSYSKNSGPVGEITVTPTMPTTTYTITAFGQQGKNAISTLTVSTKISQPSLSVTYKDNISTVVVKDNKLLNTTRISWNAINLGINDKLYINGQQYPTSGDKEVPESSSSYQSSYEYKFVIKDSVTNQIKVEKSVPITVKFEDSNSPSRAIITSFSEISGNTQIVEGNPIKLIWTTNNTAVVDLEVDGVITQYAAQNTSGINVGVMDKDSKTFTLTAWTDANKNSTKDVKSITLIRLSKPAPQIVTFVASNKIFNNLYNKVSVTLNWKVINETDSIKIIYDNGNQVLKVNPEGTTTLDVPNKSSIKIEATKSGKTTATQEIFIDEQEPKGPHIVFFNVRDHATENPVKISKDKDKDLVIQFDFEVENSEKTSLSFEGITYDVTGNNSYSLRVSSNGNNSRVAQLNAYKDYHGTKLSDSKTLNINVVDAPDMDPVISYFNATRKDCKTNNNVDVLLTWNVLNLNSSTDVLKISYTSSAGNNSTDSPFPLATSNSLVVKNNSDIKLSLYRGNELKDEKFVHISAVCPDPIINVFKFLNKNENSVTFGYSDSIYVDYSVSNAALVIIKLDNGIYYSTTEKLSGEIKIDSTSISVDQKTHILNIYAYESVDGSGKSATSQLTFIKQGPIEIKLSPRIISFTNNSSTLSEDSSKNVSGIIFSWNVDNFDASTYAIYIEQSPPNNTEFKTILQLNSASGTTSGISMMNGTAVRLIVKRNNDNNIVAQSDVGLISAMARIPSYPDVEGTITINSSKYIDENTVEISYTYQATNAKQLRVVTSDNQYSDIITGVGNVVQSFNGTKSGITVRNNSQLILYGTDGNNKEKQLMTQSISVNTPTPSVDGFSMSGKYDPKDSNDQMKMGYIKLSADNFKYVKDVKINYISLNGVQTSEFWVIPSDKDHPHFEKDIIALLNSTLTLEATDMSGKTVTLLSQKVSFDVPQYSTPSPSPSVKFFTANTLYPKVGNSVILQWQTENADDAILDQGDKQIYVGSSGSKTIQIDSKTTMVFKLIPVVSNVANTESMVSLTIEPVDKIVPVIKDFRESTNASIYYKGDVIDLRWSTTNAYQLELTSDDPTFLSRSFGPMMANAGTSVTLPYNPYVNYTLTATSIDGVPVFKVIHFNLSDKITSPDGPISVGVTPGYTGVTDVNAGGACPDPMMSVLMFDKTYKLAKDLRPGDEIYTMNESTGEYGIYKIKYAFLTQQPKLKFTFEDNTYAIVSTSHGFLLIGDKWAGASDIMIGDTIQCLSGNNKTITTIEDMGIGNVIMIEVEDAHTYILEDLISHNMQKKAS